MDLIEVWGDGSCKNTGQRNTSMGIGVVVKFNGKLIKEVAEFVGFGTSNISEWEALITGLREAVKFSYTCPNKVKIHYFADSQLIVNQFNGVYKPTKFLTYYERAVYWMGCMRSMDMLEVSWIRRELNTHADHLSKMGNPFTTLKK